MQAGIQARTPAQGVLAHRDVSQCPTHFGRYALKTGDPNAVIAWIKENTYTEAEGKNKSAEELEGKLRLGQYICVDKPIYSGTSELR